MQRLKTCSRYRHSLFLPPLMSLGALGRSRPRCGLLSPRFQQERVVGFTALNQSPFRTPAQVRTLSGGPLGDQVERSELIC